LKVPTIAFNLWRDDFCENELNPTTLKAVIGRLRASNVASTLIVKIMGKTCLKAIYGVIRGRAEDYMNKIHIAKDGK
jgi:hypothetical protein